MGMCLRESNRGNNKDLGNKIRSASIKKFQPQEYKKLIDVINKKMRLNSLSNILLCSIVICAVPIFFIALAGGIIFTIGVILKIISYKNKIKIHESKEYKNRMKYLLDVNGSDKMWQVTNFMEVHDTGANAGAERDVARKPIQFTIEKPFFLKTKDGVVTLKLKDEKLYFLQDYILIIRGKICGIIKYSDISIDMSKQRFIESEPVPKDAEVIDYTWKFLNKDGLPDERFKDNIKLPLCLYSKVWITSESGLNIVIYCSDLKKANGFAKAV